MILTPINRNRSTMAMPLRWPYRAFIKTSKCFFRSGWALVWLVDPLQALPTTSLALSTLLEERPPASFKLIDWVLPLPEFNASILDLAFFSHFQHKRRRRRRGLPGLLGLADPLSGTTNCSISPVYPTGRAPASVKPIGVGEAPRPATFNHSFKAYPCSK